MGGQLKTEIRNGEDCVDVEATENENKRLKISSDLINEAGVDDSPLLALEDRIRSINPHAPIIRTNFSRVDPKQLLNISAFSLAKVLDKEPDFLQTDGTDHVHDDTVSSVSWNFPGLELNVNLLQAWISSLMQELGTELFRYKGVLAVKGCREKFIFQGVHMLFSGGFASEVLGRSDMSSGMWKDGEERECRFVFIGKELKQKHAEKLRRDFLRCAAEETEVQGGRQSSGASWRLGQCCGHQNVGRGKLLQVGTPRQEENQCVGSHRFAIVRQGGVEEVVGK